MANERNTENLVRNLLRINGYMSDASITVEEQSSANPKINKPLATASKKGSGRGYPEFIISFANQPENLVVIECKAEVSKHESTARNNYDEYAVDGVLNYAAYLKDGFNVMAIAVSGETEKELKISHFLWIKGKQTYKDVSDKRFLNPSSLFKAIDEQAAPIREDQLIQTAIQYNDRLQRLSVPEVDRCKLISAILVALQDRAFAASYLEHFAEATEEQNPNEELVKALIDACKRVLRKNQIMDRKADTIVFEYESIKQVNAFVEKTLPRTNKPNRVLLGFIEDFNQDVMPSVNSGVFDVLGQFYTQFIRYAGSDSKTGLVLTPPHITDLFCNLAGLTEDDIVFDPCCGTGGFLVSAMNHMIKKSGNNDETHKLIRENQLIGIERRADMFTHACSNMMMRGDGKSQIDYGDCFNDALLHGVKSKNPTKAFLNPPYDVGPSGQLEFIENAMECLVPNGICVAICQMSAAISNNKDVIAVRERLLARHTLEAVLSMPSDLFYPIGVVTCIIVMKAHNPHPENLKSFFGYFKDDGHLKVKHKGRIDQKDVWDARKKQWLDCYQNRETIAGLSVRHAVTASDEWCAEAYMETDYSTLTDDDFIKTIKNYVAFEFLQGSIS